MDASRIRTANLVIYFYIQSRLSDVLYYLCDDVNDFIMKTHTNIIALAFLSLFLFLLPLGAQEKIGESIEIDKTVHNFGDIMLDSGPQVKTGTHQKHFRLFKKQFHLFKKDRRLFFMDHRLLAYLFIQYY